MPAAAKAPTEFGKVSRAAPRPLALSAKLSFPTDVQDPSAGRHCGKNYRQVERSGSLGTEDLPPLGTEKETIGGVQCASGKASKLSAHCPFL